LDLKLSIPDTAHISVAALAGVTLPLIDPFSTLVNANKPMTATMAKAAILKLITFIKEIF
jgi:hypothetical protein